MKSTHFVSAIPSLRGRHVGDGATTADRRSWAHMRLFFDEIFAP